MLLDDPSPLVRRALSEVFASCEQAPQVVVHALAADQPDVALPVLEFSPLLREDDLVDLIATGRAEAQIAVAKRCLLTRGVPQPWPRLVKLTRVSYCWKTQAPISRRSPSTGSSNASATLHRSARIFWRERICRRQCGKLSSRSCPRRWLGFVTARQWLESEHAEFAAREACEKATVALAADTSYDEVAALVRYLRQSEQLTAGMLLRRCCPAMLSCSRKRWQSCPAYRSTA
jgi:uncharacterized protein (DUF2336 family)